MGTLNAWAGCVMLVSIAVVAMGCGGLRAASSGQIGCAEKDIVITDDKVGWSSRTWTAQCHGKRFFCSSVSTGKAQSQVDCKEETAPSKPPATAAAASSARPSGGCEYDTQCKGDRICRDGQCVEPPKKASEPPPDKPAEQPGAP